MVHTLARHGVYYEYLYYNVLQESSMLCKAWVISRWSLLCNINNIGTQFCASDGTSFINNVLDSQLLKQL